MHACMHAARVHACGSRHFVSKGLSGVASCGSLLLSSSALMIILSPRRQRMGPSSWFNTTTLVTSVPSWSAQAPPKDCLTSRTKPRVTPACATRVSHVQPTSVWVTFMPGFSRLLSRPAPVLPAAMLMSRNTASEAAAGKTLKSPGMSRVAPVSVKKGRTMYCVHDIRDSIKPARLDSSCPATQHAAAHTSSGSSRRNSCDHAPMWTDTSLPAYMIPMTSAPRIHVSAFRQGCTGPSSSTLLCAAGMMKRKRRLATAPNNTDTTSCNTTLSNTMGPKPPPFVTTRTSWVTMANSTSTTTSLQTVTPKHTFAALSSPQPSSAITAMADAGLLAVMRVEMSITMTIFAVAVACISMTGTMRTDFVRRKKPMKTMASVAKLMKMTCKAMAPKRLRSSGKYISTPAAPAMKERQIRLIGSLMSAMRSSERMFVQ
mmetsp:Transcript_15191/g.47759  ORF Transcript_15191/g.47759 Transcript_15191/m.47759 type:complete len:430 (-) Transcript_15191:572-1861(-)